MSEFITISLSVISLLIVVLALRHRARLKRRRDTKDFDEFFCQDIPENERGSDG